MAFVSLKQNFKTNTLIFAGRPFSWSSNNSLFLLKQFFKFFSQNSRNAKADKLQKNENTFIDIFA